MKIRKLISITMLAISGLLASADPFNSRLSSSEREKLESGQVLIKNIETMKKVCISESSQTKQLLSSMKKLDPNYTAEIIQIRPYAGNENLIEEIKAALLNISDYAGIPYFSERTQKWYELYSSAEITSMDATENEIKVKADMEMKPFGVIHADILINTASDYLYYEMVNTNDLRYYDKFTAVKAHRMKSAISVFRDGDNWVLYAVGGVDALRVFFLTERIETSFINRIKTFCNYIFEKI